MILVFDRSGSMDGQPSDDAQAAGKDFVRIIDLTYNRVAVVSFAKKSRMEIPLGQDLNALEAAIEAIDNDHGSKISAGITMAHEELMGERHNPAASQVMVILSDGEADESDKRTLEAADLAKEQGIRIITIRLDNGSGEALMREVATTPDDAYTVATSAELHGIYQSIATPLSGCGSSSPTVEPTALPSPTAISPSATPTPIACEEDTFINASSPTKDYGDDKVMKARAGNPERWALVRCQAGIAHVSRAKLRLYVLESARGAGLFNTIDDWDEHTTWEQRPQLGSQIASLGPTEEEAWVEIDVTLALQPDGSLSIAIRSDTENSFEFATREHGKGPQLMYPLQNRWLGRGRGAQPNVVSQ